MADKRRKLGGAAAAAALDATIEQRGCTVALALVVPASTPVATAGQRWRRSHLPLRLRPDIRAGDYDYIIGVRTPSDTEIAVGGKPTVSPRITAHDRGRAGHDRSTLLADPASKRTCAM